MTEIGSTWAWTAKGGEGDGTTDLLSLEEDEEEEPAEDELDELEDAGCVAMMRES